MLCMCLTQQEYIVQVCKSAQVLSGQGMEIAMCIYGSLFVVLFTLAHSRVAGGLLVKALDCGLKGPGSLAAEFYFSSGCTQPYLKY